MAINITEETISAIQTLIHDAFDINARLDRMKTILMTSLTCPNASNMVHNVAHKYSLDIADGLGDLIEAYNEPIIYGGIEKHVEQFTCIQEVFEVMVEMVIEFQNELNGAIKISLDKGDVHIFKGLLDIVEIHNKVAESVITWKDIADKFSQHPSFDTAIVSYNMGD